MADKYGTWLVPPEDVSQRFAEAISHLKCAQATLNWSEEDSGQNAMEVLSQAIEDLDQIYCEICELLDCLKATLGEPSPERPHLVVDDTRPTEPA